MLLHGQVPVLLHPLPILPRARVDRDGVAAARGPDPVEPVQQHDDPRRQRRVRVARGRADGDARQGGRRPLGDAAGNHRRVDPALGAADPRHDEAPELGRGRRGRVLRVDPVVPLPDQGDRRGHGAAVLRLHHGQRRPPVPGCAAPERRGQHVCHCVPDPAHPPRRARDRVRLGRRLRALHGLPGPQQPGEAAALLAGAPCDPADPAVGVHVVDRVSLVV